jgi:hypothetical protein
MLSKRKQESVIKEAVGPIKKVKIVLLGEHSDVGSLLLGRLFLHAELKESMHVVHVNSAWNSSQVIHDASTTSSSIMKTQVGISIQLSLCASSKPTIIR